MWAINYERLEDFTTAAKKGEFKPIFITRSEILLGEKEAQQVMLLARLSGRGEAFHCCQVEMLRAAVPKTPEEAKALAAQADEKFKLLINQLNGGAQGVDKFDGEVRWVP